VRRAGARIGLARALSKLGVCSRREAERWIRAGRVRVAGRVERAPGRGIDPGRDRLSVDGRRVGERPERVVIAFHKPAGLVTTRVDPGGRPSVYERLGGVGRWVFPVGRLDRDSAGLLVLTNDHRLGQRLTDPGAHVPRTYHVLVHGLPDRAALAALADGVPLPGGAVSRPARVRPLGAARGGRSWLEIVLTEGKKRQVRRMCAGVGHEVERLVRVAIGGFALGSLAPGRWRELTPAEVRRLQSGSFMMSAWPSA
jgi:23S rRNA pseudouridine2605 synthase